MKSIQFYYNGRGLVSKTEIVAYMDRAVLERGIDRRELAEITARLIISAEARELFADLTGLEVIRSI